MLDVVRRHSQHTRIVSSCGHLAGDYHAAGTLLAGCPSATWWLLLMLHELVGNLQRFSPEHGGSRTTNVVDDISHAVRGSFADVAAQLAAAATHAKEELQTLRLTLSVAKSVIIATTDDLGRAVAGQLEGAPFTVAAEHTSLGTQVTAQLRRRTTGQQARFKRAAYRRRRIRSLRKAGAKVGHVLRAGRKVLLLPRCGAPPQAVPLVACTPSGNKRSARRPNSPAVPARSCIGLFTHPPPTLQWSITSICSPPSLK
eukprot:545789-Amphidinium_carterae.1